MKAIVTALLILPFHTSGEKVDFSTLIRAVKKTQKIETKPIDSYEIFADTTVATYYHSKFVGRKTASGSIFSNQKLTAAHNTIPLGSRIRVTNIHNGKQVEVTVNDRGGMGRGVTLDLSTAAFQKLQDLDAGRVTVRIETKKSYEPNM